MEELKRIIERFRQLDAAFDAEYPDGTESTDEDGYPIDLSDYDSAQFDLWEEAYSLMWEVVALVDPKS